MQSTHALFGVGKCYKTPHQYPYLGETLLSLAQRWGRPCSWQPPWHHRCPFSPDRAGSQTETCALHRPQNLQSIPTQTSVHVGIELGTGCCLLCGLLWIIHATATQACLGYVGLTNLPTKAWFALHTYLIFMYMYMGSLEADKVSWLVSVPSMYWQEGPTLQPH